MKSFWGSPYLWGIVAVLCMYLTSIVVTRTADKGININPFALACGADKNLSASLLQFLLFTYLTIFSYVAVFAARLGADKGFSEWLTVPQNLLILMGISVVSATASKGIVVSYVEQGKLPPPTEDKSGVTTDKDGQTALTKVQMIIWTIIAVGIYLLIVLDFLRNKKYLDSTELPDVDGSLLVLMGAAQGAYLGGKLVTRTTGAANSQASPVIAQILPSPVSITSAAKVSIHGILFGSSPDGSMVKVQNKSNNAIFEVPAIPAAQWKDNRIEFDLPAAMKAPGMYTLSVTVNTQESKGLDLEVKA
jgi:hypothetical protein